jgi:FtsP/CotA-like multicopper oxidase with cupredoxin domain
MEDPAFPLTRRQVLAAFGASAFGAAVPHAALAQARPSLVLQAKPGVATLRPGLQDTPIWSLLTPPPASRMRFKRGDELEVTLGNDLPVPAVLNWHGIDGAAVAEPLTARPPLASGAKDTFIMPLRHAGTFLCDLRLLGDGQARPAPACALVVQESEPATVDRDEVVLVEDWRLRPDGSAVAPGADAKDTVAFYTANGQASLELATRTNERLRIRFINGFQRHGIALKIKDHDIQVMAIDGQPSEPFLARNGQLVLAPGTRVDAFVDALKPSGSTSAILLHDGTEPRTIGRLVYSGDVPIRQSPLPAAAPLPSNGLPLQLDLKNALRIDLTLGGPQADWVTPATFAATSAPAFRAKPGRTVVLALTNRATLPAVLHLHGHHFRLLDRLDDGWKPFWLDTLAIDAGQTQRIAFAAEHIGRWLIESMATDWAAPRLLRWYSVE